VVAVGRTGVGKALRLGMTSPRRPLRVWQISQVEGTGRRRCAWGHAASAASGTRACCSGRVDSGAGCGRRQSGGHAELAHGRGEVLRQRRQCGGGWTPGGGRAGSYAAHEWTARRLALHAATVLLRGIVSEAVSRHRSGRQQSGSSDAEAGGSGCVLQTAA
jgi:hypothetical protein